MSSVVYPIGAVEPGCCRWCGEAFPVGSLSRKWCSKLCARRAAEFRRTGRAPAGSVPVSAGVNACLGCGAPIEGNEGRRNPKKWCSGACRVRAFRAGRSGSEASADYVEGKRAERAAVIAATSDAVCAVCGGEVGRFPSGYPLLYCSKSCTDKAARLRAVEEGRVCSVEGCGRALAANGLCGSHYSIEWARRNPDRRSAAAHRYRARLLDAWVEDVSRDEVFERDGWTCHICGGEIDPSLTFPHRLYGTLDHVVPLIKGGLHCLDNVKAAHWICNSVKRDDVEFECDDLFRAQFLGISA